ncbi:thiosulfate sulfurtransferase GlpE [Motilimonas eburnea]|uniref:thiosulfate sulfurtransferase GlpE n=1 Tax=Motilimonas eburnea TaxID=1737488 RepID=UPI001E5A4E04|nr:thiosulfate sulfurtransferase GlpE [Motilimonas eburnea]MCE2572391.1 thiosulfate sulfurtransferase GlpE [Motilimonas eburnea]
MDQFGHISVPETAEKIKQGKVVIADIRDPESFKAGHIEGAFHLTNERLGAFIEQVDFETPVIVVCYHGNSSQGAAQFLLNQGYDEVYSMDGGMDIWRRSFEVVAAQ